MQQTTLCYLERDGSFLMLHRVSKEQDANQDKWIGVGGKLEAGEAPEECLCREVKEETGLTLHSWRFRGMITFVSDCWPDEMMYLYTSEDFSGELKDCDEGTLEWVPKERIPSLNLWEGDRVMFRLLEERSGVFSLKLVYEGERLAEAKELGTYE